FVFCSSSLDARDLHSFPTRRSSDLLHRRARDVRRVPRLPVVQEASIRAITRVELPSPHHLHWPELDVDLAVESIEHPEKYPLVRDRKSTRLNSSHQIISYAVFCLKK